MKIFQSVVSFLLLSFILSGWAEVRAQSIPYKEEITLSVSARIVASSPIDIITLQNMTVQGVNPQNNLIYISPISSPNAGLLQINAEPYSNVRIKYVMEETLLDVDGNSSLTVEYELSINTLRDQGSSTPVFVGEVDLLFDESGTYFLWLGGKIDIENAESGSFTGQFTFEIEYI